MGWPIWIFIRIQNFDLLWLFPKSSVRFCRISVWSRINANCAMLLLFLYLLIYIASVNLLLLLFLWAWIIMKAICKQPPWTSSSKMMSTHSINETILYMTQYKSKMKASICPLNSDDSASIFRLSLYVNFATLDATYFISIQSVFHICILAIISAVFWGWMYGSTVSKTSLRIRNPKLCWFSDKQRMASKYCFAAHLNAITV